MDVDIIIIITSSSNNNNNSSDQVIAILQYIQTILGRIWSRNEWDFNASKTFVWEVGFGPRARAAPSSRRVASQGCFETLLSYVKNKNKSSNTTPIRSTFHTFTWCVSMWVCQRLIESNWRNETVSLNKLGANQPIRTKRVFPRWGIEDSGVVSGADQASQ